MWSTFMKRAESKWNIELTLTHSLREGWLWLVTAMSLTTEIYLLPSCYIVLIVSGWIIGSTCDQVRSGPMVKGWDSWSRDPGSIPSAGRHFWFGCGVPFILARSLRNGTENTGGPLCVCTPHMQSKDPPLPLRKRVADIGGHGYRAWLEYYG